MKYVLTDCLLFGSHCGMVYCGSDKYLADNTSQIQGDATQASMMSLSRWILNGSRDFVKNRLNQLILLGIKVTFSFHKITTKNTQIPTLYTNQSLYMTFTMIYYIRHE